MRDEGGLKPHERRRGTETPQGTETHEKEGD
jgi:hypothetical protein